MAAFYTHWRTEGIPGGGQMPQEMKNNPVSRPRLAISSSFVPYAISHTLLFPPPSALSDQQGVTWEKTPGTFSVFRSMVGIHQHVMGDRHGSAGLAAERLHSLTLRPSRIVEIGQIPHELQGRFSIQLEKLHTQLMASHDPPNGGGGYF